MGKSLRRCQFSVRPMRNEYQKKKCFIDKYMVWIMIKMVNALHN